MPNPAKKVKFDEALVELESLVEQLESGDLGLEASLKLFEKGVGLTRLGQEALLAAEQKVELLLGHSTGSAVESLGEAVDD